MAELKDIALRAAEVADLDPYAVRRPPSQKDAADLLGEEEDVANEPIVVEPSPTPAPVDFNGSWGGGMNHIPIILPPTIPNSGKKIENPKFMEKINIFPIRDLIHRERVEINKNNSEDYILDKERYTKEQK